MPILCIIHSLCWSQIEDFSISEVSRIDNSNHPVFVSTYQVFLPVNKRQSENIVIHKWKLDLLHHVEVVYGKDFDCEKLSAIKC